MIPTCYYVPTKKRNTMKNLFFTIVLSLLSSFGYSQVEHEIYNTTDAGGTCLGFNFFASFNDLGNCPPSFTNHTCFDVPLGLTDHRAKNESCNNFFDITTIRGMVLKEYNTQTVYYVSFCDSSNNFLLNGSQHISLVNCTSTNVTVEWSIDVANDLI